MNIRYRSSCLLIFLLYCVSACSPSAKKYKIQDIKGPDWIQNPVVSKAADIVSVGSCEKSITKASLRKQILQAQEDAKLKMSKNISSKLSAIVSSFQEQYDKTASNKSYYDKSINDFAFVKVDLDKAIRTHLWYDPAENVLFVRMAIEKDIVSSQLLKQLELYEKDLKDRLLLTKRMSFVINKLKETLRGSNWYM
jgi:hypothetical protein